jgi:hypothetical protein
MAQQLPPIPPDRVDQILKVVNYIRTRPGRSIRQRDIPQKYQGVPLSDAVFYNFIRREMKGPTGFPHVVYTAPMTDGEVYAKKYGSIRKLIRNLPIKTCETIVGMLDAVEEGDMRELDRIEQQIRKHFGEKLNSPQPGSAASQADTEKAERQQAELEADIQMRRKLIINQLSKNSNQRQPNFRFEKNDLKHNCKDLPTYQQICKRVDAIPEGDVQAMLELRDKVYAYYEKKIPGLHE